MIMKNDRQKLHCHDCLASEISTKIINQIENTTKELTLTQLQLKLIKLALILYE